MHYCRFRLAVLALSVLSCLSMNGVGQPETGTPWRVVKGRHFLVHYVQDRDFAERVQHKAEVYYATISSDLGFPKYDNFWTWDNRARIYIYPSRAAYLEATGAPRWTAGQATRNGRGIASFRGSASFLESVLPHELTHLIFNDFLEFHERAPLWLHEGIAQWEDPAGRRIALSVASSLAARNRLMSLSRLTSLDTQDIEKPAAARTFYALSASLVGYMLQEHGSRRFRTFCGHLRDGKSLADALRFTYASSIRTLELLERNWQQHLRNTK